MFGLFQKLVWEGGWYPVCVLGKVREGVPRGSISPRGAVGNTVYRCCLCETSVGGGDEIEGCPDGVGV